MARVNFPAKWGAEYIKYMEQEFPKNVGLYDRLSTQQQEVIKAYFKWRTRTAYLQLYKDASLKVTAKKTEKILQIAGNIKDWEFAGIVDLGTLSGRCGFGHAIRYQYYAASPSTGKQIIFGSKCASDFFDVAPAMLKQMEHVRTLTFDSVKKLLFIYYTGKGLEYEKLNYSFVYELLKDPAICQKLNLYLKDGFIIMQQMLALSLPLPEHMIELLMEFNVQYQQEQKTLKIIEAIDNPELKAYALTTLVKPRSITPMLDYHAAIGSYLEKGKLNTDREDMIKLITLGHHLQKQGPVLIKLAEALKGADIRGTRIYFIGKKDTKTPAYKEDITGNNVDVWVEYAKLLPEKQWVLFYSIMWAASMSLENLRQTLPKSRSSSYVRDKFSEMKLLHDKMYVALKEIETTQFDELIATQKQYIDSVKLINETSKPEDANDKSNEDENKITIEMVWDYLDQNKENVKVPAILDILKRTTPAKLSEKQRKFLLDVYRKMVQKEMVQKQKQEQLAPKEPLKDVPIATRLFIVTDQESKRCAIISSNDACRPLQASKYMLSNIHSMAEVFKDMDANVQVVSASDYAPELCNEIYSEYAEQLMNVDKSEHKDIALHYVPLSNVIGPKQVQDIKGELGFTDAQLKNYARKIFKCEGVIDNFLKDTTAQFLYYRKTVKGV